MEEKNPIQVADRIFQVIETLSAKGNLGLMELCKETDLNKTTVHRILNSLIYMGYVKQDTSTLKYALSFKIWEIANQLLTRLDIVDIAKPFLRELVEKTGETVHLVQVDGNYAFYIDKVESYRNSVRMVSKVGKRIPLYCSAVGKAVLAEMDDDQIRYIWETSDIHVLTPHTIIDLDTFMVQIDQIRSRGYAMDDEENELGVRCIAACLKDYKGKPKYAFSLSAPVGRMDEIRIQNIAREVLITKDKIMEAWTY